MSDRARPERETLLAILDNEPMAVSVVDRDGDLVFSDVPERVVAGFRREYGPLFDDVMATGPAELAWIDALPETQVAEPRFLGLYRSGELAARVARTPLRPERATYFMAAINTSDEAVLGRTGVIYLVCKKGCNFCQYRGFDEHTLSPHDAALRMLAFQEAGAHNVQWLSPSGYTAFLLHALLIAADLGFRLPIVHKSEGEDSLSDLALLDGIIDMYVPDAKFLDAAAAPLIGLSAGYPQRLRTCLTEMARQVGPLAKRAGTRLAQRGMWVRHLVMPGALTEAEAVFAFVRSLGGGAGAGSTGGIPIFVMTHYQPLDRAATMPGIDRTLTPEERARVTESAHASGLHALVR